MIENDIKGLLSDYLDANPEEAYLLNNDVDPTPIKKSRFKKSAFTKFDAPAGDKRGYGKSHMQMGASETEIAFRKNILKKDFKQYKFLRHEHIESFKADYYCPLLKLVIDFPKNDREKNKHADDERKRIVKSYGLTVLKFTREDVLYKQGMIVKLINNHIKSLEEGK